MDIEAQVRSQLAQRATPRTETVAGILKELARLDDLQRSELKPPLSDMVAEARADKATELVQAILAWRLAGGEILLKAGPVEASLTHPPAPVQRAEPVRAVVVERQPAAGPPPTDGAKDRLAKHMAEGGSMHTPTLPSDEWPDTLARLLREGAHCHDFNDEFASIRLVLEARGDWPTLPRKCQSLLIEWLTARLRDLQTQNPGRDWRVEQAFSVLTNYSRTQQPGFCYGLARDHRPRESDWREDAEALLWRLRDMLPEPELALPNPESTLTRLQDLHAEVAGAPESARLAVQSQLLRELTEALDGGLSARDPRLVKLFAPMHEDLQSPQFRTLRRAIRDANSGAQADDEDASGGQLPEDWAWWSHTRGKRAVVLGGSPREKSRVRLEAAFQLANLDWQPAEYKRNVLQNLRHRIKSGGLDLVVVLRRFVGHDTDDVVVATCKEVGVPWVHVEHGYGVNRVRASIERFLPADAKDE